MGVGAHLLGERRKAIDCQPAHDHRGPFILEAYTCLRDHIFDSRQMLRK